MVTIKITHDTNSTKKSIFNTVINGVPNFQGFQSTNHSLVLELFVI